MQSDYGGKVVRFNEFVRNHWVSDLIAIPGIWVRLALVDIKLKLLPPRFKKKWLYSQSTACISPLTPARRAEAARLERSVVIASAHPLFFTMSCMRRALVMQSLLAARGVPSRLVFGMRQRMKKGLPDAHAWLELGDMRLNFGTSSGDQEFVAFSREKE
jgi:hypothetical protein